MKAAFTTTEQKLTRARIQLVLRQPFFGTLALRLKLLPGPVPTMATDGRRILYSADFVNGLTPAELEGVLAHEVMHCALGHQCRRGNRDSRIWNEAADLAINPILLKNGFALPGGALVEPAYYELSAEDIYARLHHKKGSGDGGQAKPKKGGTGGFAGQGNSQGSSSSSAQDTKSSHSLGSCSPADETPREELRSGAFGEVLDATDDGGAPASSGENSRQQHEWAIAAEQAVRMAKSCGHEPADVARSLSEIRESTQDWRAILRDFISSTAACDYRWTPPNRRHIAAGVYLPSVDRRGVGPIVIGVDTSGSIGQEELDQFAGEITAISDEATPEAIHVVYCDAAVQSSQVFEAGDPIELEPRGGGGTDFRPVFQWIEENDLQPVCLIYLTDLCCHMYPPIPEYPVLWATDSKRTAPFGETIRISVD